MLRKFAVLSLFASSVCYAKQPSFRCDKAKTKVETAICSSDTLIGLDLEMSTLYKAVYRRLPKEKQREFKEAQRLSMKSRDGCLKEKSFETCLAGIYSKRLQQQYIILGSKDLPRRASSNSICPRTGSQPLTTKNSEQNPPLKPDDWLEDDQFTTLLASTGFLPSLAGSAEISFTRPLEVKGGKTKMIAINYPDTGVALFLLKPFKKGYCVVNYLAYNFGGRGVYLTSTELPSKDGRQLNIHLTATLQLRFKESGVEDETDEMDFTLDGSGTQF